MTPSERREKNRKAVSALNPKSWPIWTRMAMAEEMAERNPRLAAELSRLSPKSLYGDESSWRELFKENDARVPHPARVWASSDSATLTRATAWGTARFISLVRAASARDSDSLEMKGLTNLCTTLAISLSRNPRFSGASAGVRLRRIIKEMEGMNRGYGRKNSCFGEEREILLGFANKGDAEGFAAFCEGIPERVQKKNEGEAISKEEREATNFWEGGWMGSENEKSGDRLITKWIDRQRMEQVYEALLSRFEKGAKLDEAVLALARKGARGTETSISMGAFLLGEEAFEKLKEASSKIYERNERAVIYRISPLFSAGTALLMAARGSSGEEWDRGVERLRGIFGEQRIDEILKDCFAPMKPEKFLSLAHMAALSGNSEVLSRLAGDRKTSATILLCSRERAEFPLFEDGSGPGSKEGSGPFTLTKLGLAECAEISGDEETLRVARKTARPTKDSNKEIIENLGRPTWSSSVEDKQETGPKRRSATV